MCEVARLAVDAVLRIRDSGNLDYIQILQKPGGSLQDSFLEEGFLLEKSFGVGQKHEWVHPKILVANTSMDSDKIKVDAMAGFECRSTARVCAWTASRRWGRSKRRRRRRCARR